MTNSRITFHIKEINNMTVFVTFLSKAERYSLLEYDN